MLLLIAAFWSLAHSMKLPALAAERTIVQSEPVGMTVRLAEGWSVKDGQLVPPDALRDSCKVQTSVYPDSDWKTAIESLVRDTEPSSRVLSKRSGHVAVEYHARSGSTYKQMIFIDLEDMRPRTFAVWNVENDNTDAGHQCYMALSEIIGTVQFQQ